MTEHNQTNTFSQGTTSADSTVGGGQHSGGAAESVRNATGEAVNSATTRVKETAGAVADQARQTIDEATRQTKSEISNVTDQVRQQADNLVSEQKDIAADRLGTLAGTLRETGRQLQEQDEGTMGHYAEVIADQVDMVSNFLRERNPGDLLGDVQRLARQQPELFVAGSLAVGFLIGRFIKGPSRAAMRQSQANDAYYGQGGYQSGYQGGGYQSSNYQGGAYQGGVYQPGIYQSSGNRLEDDLLGSYRGSDNPAEGTDSTRQSDRFQGRSYQGRYESSGFQGNAYQQGGQESSGYQAEGSDPDELGTVGAARDQEGYEGGNSAYETGPTITEGSDTDYPRYDPTFGGSKSGDEQTDFSPSSRR